MQNDPEEQRRGTRSSTAEDLGLSARRSEDALDRITALLARLCATPMAAIWVVEPGQQFLASVAGPLSREVPAGSVLAEQVLLHGEMMVIEDARRNARLAKDPLVSGAPQLRFFAGLTVHGRDHQPIGALCVMDVRVRKLDEAGRAALTDLGALLEDRLRLRADVLSDPQSGARARMPFEDIAAREWRRARRDLVPISVIVAELDRVEALALNGPALDHGMRAAALAMQYSLNRPGDCVCRYDASRFVLLLPGTDGTGAAHTAERLRRAVETLVVPLDDASRGEAAAPLTISQGIQTVPSEALTRDGFEESVRIATVAMKEAQNAGGNCWVLTPATRRLAHKTPH